MIYWKIMAAVGVLIGLGLLFNLGGLIAAIANLRRTIEELD